VPFVADKETLGQSPSPSVSVPLSSENSPNSTLHSSFITEAI